MDCPQLKLPLITKHKIYIHHFMILQKEIFTDNSSKIYKIKLHKVNYNTHVE